MRSQPHVFQCGCGATHNSPDHRIPVGWSQHRRMVWCRDCTDAGVPERHYREKRSAA